MVMKVIVLVAGSWNGFRLATVTTARVTDVSLAEACAAARVLGYLSRSENLEVPPEIHILGLSGAGVQVSITLWPGIQSLSEHGQGRTRLTA
jgi:hypothetical protein